jgi:hypothetical protein
MNNDWEEKRRYPEKNFIKSYEMFWNRPPSFRDKPAPNHLSCGPAVYEAITRRYARDSAIRQCTGNGDETICIVAVVSDGWQRPQS